MFRETHIAALVTAGALCLVTAPAVGQLIRYVDDDAPPSGNGQTWAAAFDDLQEALAEASTSRASADEIGNDVPDERELTEGLCEAAKLVRTTGDPEDSLGFAVGVDGDSMILGAYKYLAGVPPYYYSRAYIYSAHGVGWAQEGVWLGDLNADGFGHSVAISGNYAVIGAQHNSLYWEYEEHIGNAGAANFLTFNGSSWSTWPQKVFAADPEPSDYFGCSVAIDGSCAVIGARGRGVGVVGSLFVYRRTTTWRDPVELYASDGAFQDRFGIAVAISGDVVVGGSPADDDDGESSGSAYVFRYDGAQWPQEAKLTASDAGEYSYFGRKLAVDGPVLVVGAPEQHSAYPGSGTGSVYVFRYDGSNWVEEAKLVASDAAAEDYFGSAVAVTGATIIVGARYDDDLGDNSGSAYVYRFDGANWVEQLKLLASDGMAGDEFGVSVAFDGETAVVGARNVDIGAGVDVGAAYVFKLAGPDCNSNGTIDACDIVAGTSPDCQTNGVPDECDADCNTDGLPDDCETDVAEQDCNTDGICNGVEIADCPPGDPACTDCNTNGIPDGCEDLPDCNTDGVVDACETDPAKQDCDTDGICNGAEIANCPPADPGCADCNTNSMPDECDIRDATSPDCQTNGVPDECESDCDGDGLPDACEADVAQQDCNTDGVCNGEEIAACPPDDPACADCNDNGLPDGCEPDCNTNEVADECDIRDGTSQDSQPNGVPDECEPVYCEFSKLLADDGADGDEFGYSVAVSGDTVVVGAFDATVSGHTHAGAAYVFRLDGSTWVHEAKLTSSDPSYGDEFGRSVAIDGDVAVVGAPRAGYFGQAHVFRYQPGPSPSWALEAVLEPFATCLWARFGWSVAIDGDLICVGSIYDDTQGDSAGAAYIFRFDGLGWVAEAKVIGADVNQSDYFGYSVSVDNDTVVIGTIYQQDGAAYAFRYNGGTWAQEAKLLPSDGEDFISLGAAVAVEGDTAVVGAPAGEATYMTGAAYVFTRSGSSWSQQARLLAADGASNDCFGCSVALEGNTIVAGAYADDDNGQRSGSAYFFQDSGAAWVQVFKLLPYDGAEYDHFGSSVGLSGEVVIVGSPADEVGAEETGSVRIFDSTASDCTSNGMCDGFETAEGISPDCNTNAVPDECEPDCDGNGLPDDCETDVAQQDCDTDGICNGEEIAHCHPHNPLCADCNTNSLPDGCEPDCNTNDVADECDIRDETSQDRQPNGIPDECECMVLAVRSCMDHGGTRLCLDMGPREGVEPRLGQAGELEIDLGTASGVAEVVRVDCSPTAWGGVVPLAISGSAGDTVTVEFSPALPNQSCCEIELDCGAELCVRNCSGDMDRSGQTNTTDASQVKLRFGQTATEANCEWDFNLSGTIDTTDASQVKLHFGRSTPWCP